MLKILLLINKEQLEEYFSYNTEAREKFAILCIECKKFRDRIEDLEFELSTRRPRKGIIYVMSDYIAFTIFHLFIILIVLAVLFLGLFAIDMFSQKSIVKKFASQYIEF